MLQFFALDIYSILNYYININLIFLLRGVAFTAKSSLQSKKLSALLAAMNVVSKTLPSYGRGLFYCQGLYRLRYRPFCLSAYKLILKLDSLSEEEEYEKETRTFSSAD